MRSRKRRELGGLRWRKRKAHLMTSRSPVRDALPIDNSSLRSLLLCAFLFLLLTAGWLEKTSGSSHERAWAGQAQLIPIRPCVQSSDFLRSFHFFFVFCFFFDPGGDRGAQIVRSRPSALQGSGDAPKILTGSSGDPFRSGRLFFLFGRSQAVISGNETAPERRRR